ncbi:hypothetical protein ACO1O0_008721 [Amphichorda felina]
MFTVSRGLARTPVGAARIRPAAGANVAALLAGASSRRHSLYASSSTPHPRYSSWEAATQRSSFRSPSPKHGKGRPRSTAPARDNVPADATTVEMAMRDGQTLEYSWGKDNIFFFNKDKDSGNRVPALMLRDSCSCTACRDVSSGQKTYATTQLPLDIKITDVRQTEQGGLVVTVDKDMDTHGGSAGHSIHLSPRWVQDQLRPTEHPPMRLLHRFGKTYWDRQLIQSEVRRIDYHEFMQEDSTAFWDVIQDLARLGLVFLRNVPSEEGAVERIATRIGNIRETFYGRTFDVRAKPNAENVAYTSGYLGLHQDLMYLHPPPYIQILHCMDNSCQGGESLFSDAERVGHILHLLRSEFPVLNTLADIPVPYGYERGGKYYRQRRPLLNTSRERQDFEGVWWSPPFQAEWRRPRRLDGWIAAARIFEEAVNSPEAMYQTRMEPGDCALFNNLRVLHGRTAFDAAVGSRWLRGTYLALEDFLSAAMQAPASHAAPMEEPDSWWSRREAEEQLETTAAYEKLGYQAQDAQSSVSRRKRETPVRAPEYYE